ncbi:MAG: hypothetical protein IID51_12995 [Proteobacteria bacterium]|nr:hypothetical protein [Pseudomonadota bacterium]
MAQKGISWVLVGVFGYAWWWIGYQWAYLNVPEVDWSDVFLLFTLISLVVLRGAKSDAAGEGMFDKLVSTVTGFLPSLPWLVLAILVGNTIFALQYAGFAIDSYLQAVIVAVTAGLTTALWVGAINNAGE